MGKPVKADLIAIKSFVVAQRWGVLSTHSQSHEGYPFGSLVPYDIDTQGNVYIYISLIAEHYKNLKAQPRASLLVLDSFGIADPQAHARATILLDFQMAPETQREKPRLHTKSASRNRLITKSPITFYL